MRYVRSLTDAEQEELETMAQQEVGRIALRAQLILLSSRGYSVQQIQEIQQITHITVYKWLDEVVTQVTELEAGKLTIHPGNYSAYANERELRRLRQQQQYITQQKEIAQIESAIVRFELWASQVVNERHIKQARSRRKMLERMEANGEIIERVTEGRLMNLQIAGSRGSTKALTLTGVSMGFDDDLIFLDLDLLVEHGERVGLIGPNGAGKSLLFRLILEQLDPLEGQIKIGPSTRIGYYAQAHQTCKRGHDAHRLTWCEIYARWRKGPP